jgi:hypothetical protein
MTKQETLKAMKLPFDPYDQTGNIESDAITIRP